MRGCLGRIARAVVCVVAVVSVGVACLRPRSARQNRRKPSRRPSRASRPSRNPSTCAKASPAGTRRPRSRPAPKRSRTASSRLNDQALAYLNRGLSESGPGSEARSKDDYKAAIRIFNELILGSPMQPYYYTQRGVIYQTIGEADRAILDYSDAIRLAPRETYPLINRGVLLYLRKDNNEGAIADLTAALKLKPCEVSAWANRGIVYKRKGDDRQGHHRLQRRHQVPAAQDRADPPERGSRRHHQPALDATAGAEQPRPAGGLHLISSAGSPTTTSSSTTRRSPISARPSGSIPPTPRAMSAAGPPT